MRKLLFVFLFGSFVLSAFAVAPTAPDFDPERIRAHVKYLASDELEGRGTGQKGGDMAADYIAEQFKSYGLKPAGENGTYFQKVPMVGVKTLSATTFTLVPDSGAALELKNLDDYVTSNERQTETATINAPIVFVGYGISAPEYQWDDYKGYDLKGKVALLFVNEPVSDDPKFFKGKALTYYGRWTYKFEETARHGAIATFIIHREDLASYPWTVVRNSWGGERHRPHAMRGAKRARALRGRHAAPRRDSRRTALSACHLRRQRRPDLAQRDAGFDRRRRAGRRPARAPDRQLQPRLPRVPADLSDLHAGRQHRDPPLSRRRREDRPRHHRALRQLIKRPSLLR